MPNSYSNKAPTGWNKEEKTQVAYFHKYDSSLKKWVRDMSQEFGPFLESTTTLYTSSDNRGIIFSSGEFPLR